MQDNKQENIRKEEKKFQIVVTATEAEIVKRWRNLNDFGQLTLVKHAGVLHRLEELASQMPTPIERERSAIELEGKPVI